MISQLGLQLVKWKSWHVRDGVGRATLEVGVGVRAVIIKLCGCAEPMYDDRVRGTGVSYSAPRAISVDGINTRFIGLKLWRVDALTTHVYMRH